MLRRAIAGPRVWAPPRRALSSGAVVDEVTAWSRAMEAKYGAGTYKLFRPLYKDLADEMRREALTKPPPPMDGWVARHDEAENLAVFSRAGDEGARTGRVVAYCPIVMGNPPKLNDLLHAVDWFPVEALVERNGVVLHFSVAASEGGMHMRNVRASRRSTRHGRGGGMGRDGAYGGAAPRGHKRRTRLQLAGVAPRPRPHLRVSRPPYRAQRPTLLHLRRPDRARTGRRVVLVVEGVELHEPVKGPASEPPPVGEEAHGVDRTKVAPHLPQLLL
ncbi:hypothetical protein, conserved (fragment), partial [Trypanosoma vivax Y486]